MSAATSTDRAFGAAIAVTAAMRGAIRCWAGARWASLPLARLVCGGALLVMAASSIYGCSTTPEVRVEYRTVEVPVPVHRRPPESLVRPYRPERAPLFHAPGAEGVTSCLRPDGEEALSRILIEMDARDRAWRGWASE